MPFPYPVTTTWFFFLARLALGTGNGQKGRPMKELMPWYHSAHELRAQLSDLLGSCQADLEVFKAGNLEAVRVRPIGVDVGTKAVLVFGEHPRELISPEAALGLVRNLCGKGDQAEFAKETLAKGVEFVIVPNSNPTGRKAVEDGYYCKRTNDNGVDINRNWGDEHRDGLSKGDEQYPGPHGFSEPETRALRDLIGQEKPDLYLSVHSGDYLLGAPPGYKTNSMEDKVTIGRMLRPISFKYCDGRCPFGGLRDMVGYNVAGCDIDYIHERAGVPYAFSFEIYNGFRQDLPRRLQNVNVAQRPPGQAFLSVEATRRPSRLEEDDEDPDMCISRFSPTSQSQTTAVVENWVGAFLDLASIVRDRKQSDATTSSPTTSRVSEWEGPVPNSALAVDAQVLTDVAAFDARGPSEDNPLNSFLK